MVGTGAVLGEGDGFGHGRLPYEGPGSPRGMLRYKRSPATYSVLPHACVPADVYGQLGNFPQAGHSSRPSSTARTMLPRARRRLALPAPAAGSGSGGARERLPSRSGPATSRQWLGSARRAPPCRPPRPGVHTPSGLPMTTTPRPPPAAPAWSPALHRRRPAGVHRPLLQSRPLHPPMLFPPQTRAAYDSYLEQAGEAGARGLPVPATAPRWPHRPHLGRSVHRAHGAFRCGAIGYGAFAHAGGAAHGRGAPAARARRLRRDGPAPAGGQHPQPANTRSIALVERARLPAGGFSPDFLPIDGAWRDHERWAITSEMRLCAGEGAGKE